MIEVGDRIGTLATLALLGAAAVGGAFLLKRGSLSALTRAQETMRRGGFPAAELFDAAATIVAALLFILPGFVSDALALLLLLPPVRALLRRRLARLFRVEPPARAGVIEGEWREIPEPPKNLPHQ